MRRLNPFASAAPKGKRKRKAPRRRVAPRWLRPALFAAGAVTLFGAAAGSGYWAWTSGAAARTTDAAYAAIIDLTIYAGLTVDEILVEGRVETTKAQLLEVIDAARGDPIVALDTNRVRKRLVSIGWIADAVVERRLPGTIYIRLQERQAMAIWQRDGKFMLVDPDGIVIGTAGLERFTHLKIIIGDSAPQHAPALLDMLSSAPELMQRVRAGIWVGNRRWNLRLDDGIDIRLPEKDPQAAWARLVALDRDRQLLSHDITAIDLRIRDRLIVQRRDRDNQT